MVATSLKSAAPKRRAIRIRQISSADLGWSLKEGLSDMREHRGDIFFAGVIYTVVGLLAIVMATSRALLPLVFPVLAGIGLLGPVAALGFYEIARRRERGEEAHWFDFRALARRSTVDDMGIIAGLLLTLFFAWLLTAAAIYAALFGFTAPASIESFVTTVFTTERGWAMIVLGAAAGAIFGWLVLALSVVSLPMLVDSDVTAAEALSTSWRAANANKSEMIRWGLIVTALLALGSVPLFVGLAVVLPWLGYSTWHLYTRLVDRERIPARKRRRD